MLSCISMFYETPTHRVMHEGGLLMIIVTILSCISMFYETPTRRLMHESELKVS